MDLLHLEPKAIWKTSQHLMLFQDHLKGRESYCFHQKFWRIFRSETSEDETGNVIIRKPATPGMENRKTTILQSHLDMVCQKNNDTDFDFDTQESTCWLMGTG